MEENGDFRNRPSSICSNGEKGTFHTQKQMFSYYGREGKREGERESERDR